MPNSSSLFRDNSPITVLESNLRRFDIHLVKNLGDLYNYFPIAKDDDRVRPLVCDDFCVADRDCFRRGIDRFRRKFLRDVQVAAAGAAGIAVVVVGAGIRGSRVILSLLLLLLPLLLLSTALRCVLVALPARFG